LSRKQEAELLLTHCATLVLVFSNFFTITQLVIIHGIAYLRSETKVHSLLYALLWYRYIPGRCRIYRYICSQLTLNNPEYNKQTHGQMAAAICGPPG